MSSVKIFIFLVIILLALENFACSEKPKEHYIKKETFSKALQEMLVIQYLKIKEPQKAALIKDILKKNHINKKEFKATKIHYAQEPQFWVDVFKEIKQRLNDENRRLQRKVKQKQRK